MRTYLFAVLALIFTPASGLAQQGEWEQLPFDFGIEGSQTVPPIVAVHLIHLHTGKVLAITFDPDDCPSAGGNGRNYLWTPPPYDPQNPGHPGTFENLPNCHNWSVCAGHSAMADGRILIPGSHWAYWQNAPPADLFDPSYMSTTMAAWNLPNPPPNMAQGRWYPTATTLADGKVLVTSGTIYHGSSTVWVKIPELYDPNDGPNGTFRQLAVEEYQQYWYPFMFLLPDGNLVDAGPG